MHYQHVHIAVKYAIALQKELKIALAEISIYPYKNSNMPIFAEN